MNKFEKSLLFIKEHIHEDSRFYRQIFLVGGCVRDELLGERYSDLDLLINMPNGQREFVEYMCATYPETCKGPFYYQRYGTTAMDVIIDGSMTLVECVEPHIEEYDADGQTLIETHFCSLEEDSSRRDYTCNALYKNLHTGKVLDPTGRGLQDLKDKLLITPSEPNRIYRQDPVRMLRGIRFKHQKGFKLDAGCWDAIVENHNEMALSAPKRLRDELNKLLKSRTFGEGIDDLLQCGLLTYVMPGLTEYLQDETPLLPQGEESLTLWQHTRLALYTQGREHPRTETIYKLAILVMDVALRHGREAAAEVLVNAGIGKEKVISILHITELYKRFGHMYDHGQYVARPRELPHFINALSKGRDDFRRMVRALNSGLHPDVQLPWRIFYDDGERPQPRQHRSRRNGISTNNPSTVTDNNNRRHKRNVKRREQRKRARTRRQQEAANTNE